MRISLLCLSLLVTASPAWAQSLKPPEDRTLTAPDGWPLRITYYETNGDKESPVAILIPGVEGPEDSRTRKVWDGVAKALQKEKYAVVTVDLRKHGDSIYPEDDPRARFNKFVSSDLGAMIAADLETVKAFLLQEHENQKLNIRKLGIAAAGSSCLVATSFAVRDWSRPPWNDAPTAALMTPKGQDVRAILMLSPKSRVSGVRISHLSDLNRPIMISRTLTVYPDVAMQIWHNAEIRAELAAAKRVFGFVELKGKNLTDEQKEARMLKVGPPDKTYTAEALLEGRAGPVMEKNIKEFFDKFVKARPETWKTRKSKLE